MAFALTLTLAKYSNDGYQKQRMLIECLEETLTIFV